jgi:hypothetical protein
MSKARIVTIAIGIAVFIALLLTWQGFLEKDQCFDAGGGFRNGVCASASGQTIGFWRWHPGFIAALFLPPLFGALVAYFFVRFTFVRDDVPPNTSLERTRD